MAAAVYFGQSDYPAEGYDHWHFDEIAAAVLAHDAAARTARGDVVVDARAVFLLAEHVIRDTHNRHDECLEAAGRAAAALRPTPEETP